MSELVTYELNDGIAVLTLNNGKVNALSSWPSMRPWTARRRPAPSWS